LGALLERETGSRGTPRARDDGRDPPRRCFDLVEALAHCENDLGYCDFGIWVFAAFPDGSTPRGNEVDLDAGRTRKGVAFVGRCKAPDGFHITPYDPEFEATVKLAEGFMGRYRNALRELAK
jgi:hypothetical protein